MIKVTLPNGITIETDNLEESVAVVSAMVNPAPPLRVSGLAKPKPEPKPEPTPTSPSFPHKEGDGPNAVKIGGREDQILRAAKILAEEAGNRDHEFRSAEVDDLCGTADLQKGGSGQLITLAKKGLVRHGSHRRVWVITAKGWNSKFRVTQPIRKDLP